eukprot:s9209_g1.t1
MGWLLTPLAGCQADILCPEANLFLDDSRTHALNMSAGATCPSGRRWATVARLRPAGHDVECAREGHPRSRCLRADTIPKEDGAQVTDAGPLRSYSSARTQDEEPPEDDPFAVGEEEGLELFPDLGGGYRLGPRAGGRVHRAHRRSWRFMRFASRFRLVSLRWLTTKAQLLLAEEFGQVQDGQALADPFSVAALNESEDATQATPPTSRERSKRSASSLLPLCLADKAEPQPVRARTALAAETEIEALKPGSDGGGRRGRAPCPLQGLPLEDVHHTGESWEERERSPVRAGGGRLRQDASREFERCRRISKGL